MGSRWGLMPRPAPPQSKRTGRGGEAGRSLLPISAVRKSLGVARCHWQFHPEGGALTRLRIEADPALHLLDEPARDVQTEPGAAFLASRRGVGLRKSLKDPRTEVLRDSGARVAHAD